MKALARTAAVTAACLALISAAQAAPCMKAGGWGTGVVQNLASFMAQAALKNQAKAWGGDAVKIGKITESCGWKTVSYECTAQARACK